jgi:hypothetical protein
VINHVNRAGLGQYLVLNAPARVVRDSRMSDTVSVYFNVADSVSGSRFRSLVDKVVQIDRYACRFRAARANPGVALCTRCWRWGHPSSACRAPQTTCPACSGPHRFEHHRALSGCCRGNAKATPPVPPTAPGAPCPHPARCPNCRKDHAADSRKCNFWRHRFDKDWIQARYAEVRERRRLHSPVINHPATGGGRT